MNDKNLIRTMKLKIMKNVKKKKMKNKKKVCGFKQSKIFMELKKGFIIPAKEEIMTTSFIAIKKKILMKCKKIILQVLNSNKL